MTDQQTETAEVVEFERRLTIAHRIHCECAPYFLDRGDVIVSEVVKEAERRDLDPVDLFAAYARGVHRRHESGLSLAVSA